MQVTDIDLQSIAAEIWAAVLGLEVNASVEVKHHDPDEQVVTGSVQITGDWSGVVTVQLSERFARHAASLMFAMELDEVTEEETIDTVGELANMTGGNVKSTLAGSCQLSLPSVTVGREYRVSVPGTQLRDRRALDCGGELLVVTLLEQSTRA